MTGVFYLLCVFALLGAFDVGYFHLYRFRLYRVPSSRGAHLTHVVRAGLFIAALSWAMVVKAEGAFSLGLPLIMLVDFVNAMADVLLEPSSRSRLGGLPPLEYAMHMAAMFVSGAIAALAIVDCAARLSGPARLSLAVLDVPAPALAIGCQALGVAVALLLVEVAGCLRSFGGVRHARSSSVR